MVLELFHLQSSHPQLSVAKASLSPWLCLHNPLRYALCRTPHPAPWSRMYPEAETQSGGRTLLVSVLPGATVLLWFSGSVDGNFIYFVQCFVYRGRVSLSWLVLHDQKWSSGFVFIPPVLSSCAYVSRVTVQRVWRPQRTAISPPSGLCALSC